MMEQQAIVQAVQNAARDVFATMLDLELNEGEPYIEKIPPGPSEGVISVIGMAGKWIGTGSLCCSGALARRLSAQLLMMEFDQVNEEVLDAVAEVTNMIIGNFKNLAEPHLGPLGLTIPTVIYGLKFVARSAGKESWTVIPFRCAGELLEIKILLTPNRGFSQMMSHPAATQPARS